MSTGSEYPSELRLRQARERGDLPLSPGLTSAGALLAVLPLLPWVAGQGHDRARALLREVAHHALTPEQLPMRLLREVVELSLPPLICAALGAVTVGALQTRGYFSRPSSSRQLWLSWSEPGAILSRAAISCGTIALFSILSFGFFRVYLADMGNALWQPGPALELGGALAWRLLGATAAVGICMGGLEWLAERSLWLDRLKMTPHEQRREQREQRGPLVWKERRQRAHRQAVGAADVLAVRHATLVLHDSTGLAAFHHDARKPTDPPTIVFVVRGELAREGLALARTANVPTQPIQRLRTSWFYAEPGAPIEPADYHLLAHYLSAGSNQAPDGAR